MASSLKGRHLPAWLRAMLSVALINALCALAACGGGGGNAGAAMSGARLGAPAQPALTLSLVSASVKDPIYVLAAPGDTRRLFVVERAGRVRIMQDGALLAAPFLDISARTSTDGERGLLSLAFHPQFATNGYVFLCFTDVDGNIALERMHASSASANAVEPLSALRVLSIAHPGANNHYGGMLNFGADGYLYLGTGDGGGEGDPAGNGQNQTTLLGKMLRIDVNGGPGAPYSIPRTNPYAASGAGARPEIWATGLRNPWRYSFDAPSGLLYLPDVGQDQREEINIVPASQAGNNYGWSTMEGSQCYRTANCAQQGLTLPAFEYLHDTGCAIIGGYVYRGNAIPGVRGQYFYSDYCKGYLKSLSFSGGKAAPPADWPIPDIGRVLSFGTDAQGELYMVATKGVYRIVPG